MGKHKNVLVSGKLGDLFHSLWVCHHLYKKHGFKSNILMTDTVEKFEYGLIPTYNELYDIVSKQPYCYQFNLHNEEPIDYDTTAFRRSPYLYRACWTEILCQAFFDGDSPKLGSWINLPFDVKKEDRIIISRRYKNEMTDDVIAFYDKVTMTEQKVYFLGGLHDYQLFPFKDRIEHIIPNSIEDWLGNIYNSSLFIGNQSSPLAMASALNVRRIAELLPPNFPDGAHYKNESKYYDNFIKYVI
jgi:hypothetical protein